MLLMLYCTFVEQCDGHLKTPVLYGFLYRIQ